ncbi:MAG: hypothetical protein WD398_03235 [Cyclobacteriaceae bacterium]
MKNDNLNLNVLPLILFLSLSLFSSCVDEPLEGPVNNNDRDIKELTASTGFEWKTSRSVEVNLKALPIEVGIDRRLTFADENGSLFYSGKQSMDENFKMEFDLPDHIKQVSMLYGDILKTAEIIDGKVFFDFLNVDNEEVVEN